jgi:hypothetical protein
MSSQTAGVIDNRDSQEMYGYLEARIESLKRRIVELQHENDVLRSRLTDNPMLRFEEPA